MGTSRSIAAALSALAVLGACGGPSPQEPITTVATRPTTTQRTTTTVATTTTTLPKPPEVLKAALLTAADVPGTTASPAVPVLTITGDLISQGGPMPVGFELLVFRKGGAVFFLKAEASRGPVVPGQSVELALKMATRLS